MRGLLHITLTLLLAIAITLSNSSVVLADGENGEYGLEVEVNGIHVSLANQNKWKKGENTIVVTLKDSSGSPVHDAQVEILIGPMSEEHATAGDDHGVSEAAPGHAEEQGHSSMPGMEMNEPAAGTQEMPAHDEEKEPISLEELGEHGIYVVETHVESAGMHEVNVMFHFNGQMLQADFVVEIPGVLSKTMVLWSFVAINIVLITSAGITKRRAVPVKGR